MKATEKERVAERMGEPETFRFDARAGEEPAFRGWRIGQATGETGAAGVRNEAHLFASTDGEVWAGIRVDVEEESPRRASEFAVMESFPDLETAASWLRTQSPDVTMAETAWNEAKRVMA